VRSTGGSEGTFTETKIVDTKRRKQRLIYNSLVGLFESCFELILSSFHVTA
jgi:hypothetical protein